MITRKHLLLTSALCMIIAFCCSVSQASTLKKYGSGNTGSIKGKVTNTAGSPLPNIPISIQLLTKETIYGTDFEEAATTDKNGKFKITGLASGNYIARAGPSTDASYLAN
ncbi:MAG: carboxypeptidase-like regulatory domain-containing protein, partial [Planctomycetota bacterium]